MHQIVKNIATALLGIIIISMMMLMINYYKADNLIEEEIAGSVMHSGELVNQDIINWVEERKIVLENYAELIGISDASDEALIEKMMQATVKAHPEFTSIYFSTPEQHLIISSDWQPDADFDLTRRPWYTNAIETNKISFTDPFVDAITHEMVVCMSMPVYDSESSFIGVVSGDILLKNLEAYLEAFTKEIMGNTYLVDENGTMLLNFSNESTDITAANLMALYADEHEKSETNSLFLRKSLSGIDGFFQFYEVPYSHWKILSFSPMSNYNEHSIEMRTALNILVVLMFGIFLLVSRFQYKQIIKPLVELEHQIDAIDIDNHYDYRIALTSNGIFENVQFRINTLLDHLTRHIKSVSEDREELHALNEELEASFGQLVAIEQEVSMQKLHFEALFKNSPYAVAMFDQDHHIVDINESFQKLFGYALNEVFGMGLDDIVLGEYCNASAVKRTEDVFRGEIVAFEDVRYTKDGEPITVSITGVGIDFEGEVIGGYGIYVDVSEQKERERRLEYVSNHDYLTDIYNRYYFEKHLVEIDSPASYPITVVMADVNGLKLINDAFGSEKGDEMLIETSKLLTKYANEINGVLCRIGGDEFAIVFTRQDKEVIDRLMRNIRRACRSVVIDELQLSLAIGWSEKSTLEKPMSKVLKEAEDYMFKQKLNENPSVRGKTIKTIMNTLHEKSNREEQHSKRVSKLSYDLGKALKLSQRELNELRTLGLLHDVGKIAIDDKILNKADKLNEIEYAEIKKHPEIGYRILSSVTELSEIATHVLAHHERWDGQGYPQKLKGKQIPYLARIVSITDAYDAMTSTRTYRKGLSEEDALIELEKNAGSQFDASLVKVFVSMIRSLPHGEEM